MVSPTMYIVIMVLVTVFAFAAIALSIATFVDLWSYKDHTHQQEEFINLTEHITNIIVEGGGEGGTITLPDHTHKVYEISDFYPAVTGRIPDVTYDKRLLHTEISTAPIPSSAHHYTVNFELTDNDTDAIHVIYHGGFAAAGTRFRPRINHLPGAGVMGITPSGVLTPPNSNFILEITMTRYSGTGMRWFFTFTVLGGTNPEIYQDVGTLSTGVDYTQPWQIELAIYTGSANVGLTRYYHYPLTGPVPAS